MPTTAQARKAWLHMAKGQQYYEAMTPEQKAAAWTFGRDQGYFQPDKLDDYKKSEFNKYVKSGYTRYTPNISKEELPDVLQYDSHAVYQGPKVALNKTFNNTGTAAPTSTVIKKGRDLGADEVGNTTNETKLPKGMLSNKGVPINFNTTRLNKGSAQTGAFAAGLSDAVSLGYIPHELERFDPSIKQAYEKAKESNPIAYGAGQFAGYVAPGTVAEKGVGTVIKGAGLGAKVARGAISGAALVGGESAIKGNNAKTVAKDTLIGATGGGAFEGLSYGVGKYIASKLAKGNLSKIPTQEVIPKVEPKTTNIKSTGTYKVKNTALEKAINEYNDAIETIQNHFKTNELRTDEMPRIKSELGIDLDNIVSKIADAEKGVSVSTIGKQRNWANVAGVKPLPNLNVAEKPTIGKNMFDRVNAQPIKENAAKTPTAITEELANDPTYKELTDELKGANVRPDANIQSAAVGIKDKSGLTMNLKDVYRNFRDAFGNKYDYVKKNYLDPFDASKKAYVDEVKKYTDDIYTKVVKGLDINKGSAESAAVQNYGEGLISKDALIKQFGANKANKIIEADGIFRKTYDELIDKVNSTIKQIYPNSPDKLVPKRTDYYRHFNEMAEGFQGLKNIFETPSQIDPKLAGMSEFTKPSTKWASFKQKRGEGDYTADAVGGFLDYIQPAAYSIHIDPHISKFRGLAKDIAEATQETKNANNTIKYLNDFANSLAGKTNKYDRVIQEDIPGGRTTFRAINWLNSRVKANQVLMNAQSAISQFANVPIGIARVKDPVAITKGVGQTLAGIVGKSNPAMKESQFINERYMGSLISRFDKKLIDQPQKFAAWILEGADKLGTGFTWNSAYNKAVSQGIENPVKYADDLTRSIVAGRGIGEVPILQQAKTFQLVAPFQLEVANLWHVMGDSVKEKDFASIAMILLGNYLFNNATEKLTGNRVTFDPVNAMIDALNEEDRNIGTVAGRISGEVLSNVPLGQTLAAQYPEFGADINTPLGNVSLPSRKKLFGDEDPTRFGGGLLVTKALSDPFYKVALPFGGAQLKKTIEGNKAVNEGMVANKGKLQFPVEKTTENRIKGALFGKYGVNETREYFDKDRRPLSEKQTQELLKKPDLKGNYNKLMAERRADTIKAKIKSIRNDDKLSWEEKLKKISPLQSQLMLLSRK